MLAAAENDPARSDNFQSLSHAYRAFVRVGELLALTIAAVRGHAVGAGVNLMLATDLRIVAKSFTAPKPIGRAAGSILDRRSLWPRSATKCYESRAKKTWRTGPVGRGF